MSDVDIVNRILHAARIEGAVYPTVADTDEGLVIVDTDSGRTWRVRLEEI